MEEAQVSLVSLDVEVEGTGGLQGIDIALHVGVRCRVGLADIGLQMDALHVVVPLAVDVGMPEDAVVHAETLHLEIRLHDGLLQYGTGISRTRGFAPEVHAEIGYVEHVAQVDAVQVEPNRIGG